MLTEMLLDQSSVLLFQHLDQLVNQVGHLLHLLPLQGLQHLQLALTQDKAVKLDQNQMKTEVHLKTQVQVKDRKQDQL